MRVCTKCGETKPPEDYYKEKRVNDGCKSWCKVCHNAITIEAQRIFRINNPKPPVVRPPVLTKEEKKARRRISDEKKKALMSEDEILALKAKQKEYREVNKEKNKEYKRLYQIENKERLNKISSEYHANNKENRKAYIESYLPRRRELRKERADQDEFYRMTTNLRNGVTRAFKLKGWGKTGKSEELLGADYATVKKHIERQFKKGMTWKNNTPFGWHIDHKKALSTADNIDELRALCHYTNLQPLWWKDNIIKQNKTIEHQLIIPI